MSVESLLERLLVDRGLRRIWAADRSQLPGASEAEVRALATIDLDALEDAAVLYCRDLMRRSHRGSGSLIERFPSTIAAWRADHQDDLELDELAAELCESPVFQGYRSRGGMALEEAFYRFAEARDIGRPDLREREYLAAMAIAIAVNPNPAFQLPREWCVTGEGGFAIATRSTPHLFAVCRGRVIDGAIPWLVVELLVGAETPAALAARHGLGPRALAEVVDSLTQLGLRPRMAGSLPPVRTSPIARGGPAPGAS